jgi:rSAM/selenodomain-associated transferase 2
MVPALSIIIPTLNEARCLPGCLRSLATHWPAAQYIVADGGSDDATVTLAEKAGAELLRDLPRSRGIQLRAGAAAARGDWLLFLHADSTLDGAAARAADDYRSRGEGRFAMFQLRFDSPGWLLRFSAWWTRFDSVFTRFGDQGILIQREYYQELAGFQPWPLFEDVDLIRRARKHRPIDVLPAALVTSARRFEQRGPIRQQLSNTWLLLRFLSGADPCQLACNYVPMSTLPPKR